MQKLGIEEWIVRFVQAMYNNTRSRVRVSNTYSDEFGVKDRRRHGKIQSTMISDTGSYQGQIPQTEWSGERNSEQT